MNNYFKLGKDEFKGSFNEYALYANVLKKNYKLLLANKYSNFETAKKDILEWCEEVEKSEHKLNNFVKVIKRIGFDNTI